MAGPHMVGPHQDGDSIFLVAVWFCEAPSANFGDEPSVFIRHLELRVASIAVVACGPHFTPPVSRTQSPFHPTVVCGKSLGSGSLSSMSSPMRCLVEILGFQPERVGQHSPGQAAGAAPGTRTKHQMHPERVRQRACLTLSHPFRVERRLARSRGGDSFAVLPRAMLSQPFRLKTKTATTTSKQLRLPLTLRSEDSPLRLI